MAKVVKYIPDNSKRKLGKRKEHKSKSMLLEDKGQLNLFNNPENKDSEQSPATLLQFTPRLDTFEQALKLDEKDDDNAEFAYLQAIEQGNLIPDSYCNLGIIYASKGDSVKALSSFNHCLSCNPSHLEGHYNLANMYFDLKNYELATMHYKLALQIDPDFTEVYYNIALSLLSESKYDDSLDHLKIYCNIVPNDRSARDLMRRVRILAQTQG